MAEPSEHLQSCPPCRVLERRIVELEAELAERDARIAKLEGRIPELEARVRQLDRMLLEAGRASKRQAAPFSRNQPKVRPKKPGRPVGHEPAHRPPPPLPVTETVEVPLDRCPCHPDPVAASACGRLATGYDRAGLQPADLGASAIRPRNILFRLPRAKSAAGGRGPRSRP